MGYVPPRRPLILPKGADVRPLPGGHLLLSSGMLTVNEYRSIFLNWKDGDGRYLTPARIDSYRAYVRDLYGEPVSDHLAALGNLMLGLMVVLVFALVWLFS